MRQASLAFLVRRLVQIVPVVLAIVAVNFFLLRMARKPLQRRRRTAQRHMTNMMYG